MRPRTIILESDNRLRNLLSVLLESRGHEVLAYAYPVMCPLYHQPACDCPQESPCVDILIADNDMKIMSGLEFVHLQMERGCKGMARNKMILSAQLTEEQKLEADRLGCTMAEKPFRIPEFFSWVAECESRLRKERRLGKIRIYT